MADITIVIGGYKPTYNWGAPSCTILNMGMRWYDFIRLPDFWPIKKNIAFGNQTWPETPETWLHEPVTPLKMMPWLGRGI